MDKNLRLTENFSLGEFLVSSGHPEVAARMELTPHQIYKVRIMAVTLLQPVRDRFGPVQITSGVRLEDLNRLVGGSRTSQHQYAEAVDFVTLRADLEETYHWMRFRLPNAWHQLILEYQNRKPAWLHASILPEHTGHKRGNSYFVEGKYTSTKPVEIIYAG